MFKALFDLPLALVALLILGSLGLFAAIGVTVVRRRILPYLRLQGEDSNFIGSMMQGVLVFYGLAVALMAVSVWQTYSDVSRIVSEESSSLAALYRDVSGYPEPLRSKLQEDLRIYVERTIQEAWPQQKRGIVPLGGVERLTRMQVDLVGFEPTTEGQKILHAETLRAYNHMLLGRRLRLDSVDAGLPAVMWAVIISGAFISLTSSFFFKVEDARVQLIQTFLLAGFIAMVIFMIFALDHPFRGDMAIPADPFQQILDQLMKKTP